MLKYVGILKVDQPDLWTQWHSGPTACYYKSSVETEKSKVEEWLENELQKYTVPKYSNRITIIAFDDIESQNMEEFLKFFPY